MSLTPLCDQATTNFFKSNNQTIKNFITDHLKWTPHVWEGAGKHLRAKHDGLKSHPPGQSPLLSWPGCGCSLVLINDHWSASESSELVLKIYMVEFERESVSGKMRHVLAQALKLIKSRNVRKFVRLWFCSQRRVENCMVLLCNLMKRVENTQRARSNRRVEFKR